MKFTFYFLIFFYEWCRIFCSLVHKWKISWKFAAFLFSEYLTFSVSTLHQNFLFNTAISKLNRFYEYIMACYWLRWMSKTSIRNLLKCNHIKYRVSIHDGCINDFWKSDFSRVLHIYYNKRYTNVKRNKRSFFFLSFFFIISIFLL